MTIDALRTRLTVANVLSCIVFLVVVGSALVSQSSFFFRDAVLPYTDYASNDILVTRAKEFALWHGNYSRVGFYHPGPFFFQLMAWSELLFFDLLRVFSSYFAAQVFAVVCLSAVALASVARLLHALTGRVAAAVAGVSVFVIVLMAAKAYSVSMPWPPYLYVTAATILIVGLCGVMLRGWSWMPWMLLGAGSLVHGHASFVGLAPIIVITAAAGAWLAMRRGALPNIAASMPSRSTVVVCALLIIAFGLPVVLQTLAHWPGEFPKYFSFAGHREPNEIADVVRYVLDFMPWWAVVLPVSAVAAWSMRRTYGSQCVTAATLVLVAGVVAAGLYARKGVDGLDYRYLEYWFAPFYAMFVAMVAACFISSHRAVINVVAACALAGAVFVVVRTPESFQPPASVKESQYRQAVSSMALSAHGRTTELVLDKSTEEAWGSSWTDAVSLIAYANRINPSALCIDGESWHLLFHEQYRCPAEGERPRVFVSSIFYPARTQVLATENARYYAMGKTDEALPQAGNAQLSTDEALKPIEIAVALQLQGQPAVDEKTNSISVQVLVVNRGSKPLAGQGRFPINLAVVKLAPGAVGQRAAPRSELRRIPLTGVAPGATVEMALSLPAESFADGAVVRLELVQEGVAWFTYDYGMPPLDLHTCATSALQLCSMAPSGA